MDMVQEGYMQSPMTYFILNSSTHAIFVLMHHDLCKAKGQVKSIQHEYSSNQYTRPPHNHAIMWVALDGYGIEALPRM